MFSLHNLIKISLSLIFLTLIAFAPLNAQSQMTLTIEKAENSLQQLQKELGKTNQKYTAQIKAGGIGQISSASSATERQNERREIRKKIVALTGLEFIKPVSVTLGAYNARDEFFPIVINDEASGKMYEDIFYISSADARIFKADFPMLKKQGFFGVTLDKGEAVTYCFGFKAISGSKQYTNVPTAIKLTPKDVSHYYEIYNDPYVLQTRKLINAYLKNPLNVNQFERSSFAKIDREYLESKFIVYSIDDSLLGGKELKIIFQERPDIIFTVWIYRTMELRDFRPMEIDNVQLKRILILSRQFLLDKTHSL